MIEMHLRLEDLNLCLPQCFFILHRTKPAVKQPIMSSHGFELFGLVTKNENR
jgi:hypothetical protein